MTVAGRSLDWDLEAVPLARHCLDVMRFLWVFAESAANLSDRSVDAVIGVEVNVFAPEAFDDLLAADQSAVLADQEDQEVHRDAFEAHRFPAASQFVSTYVQDEWSQSDYL